MVLTGLRGSGHFWDRLAPQYEKWLIRGTYHQPILREVSQMIEPGWKVLDIGAATGVLSIPLASLGCSVTALEPSHGMEEILRTKLDDLRVSAIRVVPDRWEDLPVSEVSGFDCVIACNSLHLCEGGIMEAMEKAFKTECRFLALITEINQGISLDFKEINAQQDRFDFLYIRNLHTDSSFHFNDMEEVYEMEELLGQKMDITIENGKPVQYDTADIAVVWWERGQ